MVTIFQEGHLQESTPLHLAPAHQLHMNLVGAMVQARSTSLPLWEYNRKYAPMWET